MAAYLDYAATSPIRPQALTAVTEQLQQIGNASSLHAAGRSARRVVEESRESIAAVLAVRPSDIVFTSGGTEADNLAIKGIYFSRIATDPNRRTIVVSAIEHHAVLDSAQWLAKTHGATVIRLAAGRNGQVDPAELSGVLAEHAGAVALVSVMWANNETGIIQPVEELARLCVDVGVPFHSDGVQAAAWLSGPGPLVHGNSALSISGHKAGGPVGIGALVLSGLRPEPLVHGGGQELDLRSGTLMTAQVSGMAAAFRAADDAKNSELARVSTLRDGLIEQVTNLIDDALLIGAGGPRLPGIAQLAFPGCEADALLMLLDAAGVECSAGSACTAGVSRPSHVLLGMGLDDDLARGALRFSLGWDSKPADVEALIGALPEAVDRARKAGASQRARSEKKRAQAVSR